MTALSPRLFVFSALTALVLSGAQPWPVLAAKMSVHSAVVDTQLERIGFLDLKTFLISPPGEEGDLGMTSRQIRVISPETLFSRQPRMELINSWATDDEPFGAGIPTPYVNAPDPDSVTVDVNGKPVALSIGLGNAMKKDIDTTIRAHGASGLFSETNGYAVAAYLGMATRDLLTKIDRLEEMSVRAPIQGPGITDDEEFDIARSAQLMPEPSTLSLFVVGLLMIGWLQRSRLFGLPDR